MNESEINGLVENDDYLVELNSNIWLMDNHRWAYYVWEKHRLISDTNQFSLVHADYHWDAINDFYDSPEKEQELSNGNLNSILKIVRENTWIRYDSFIAAAVIRGFISDIHFYCKQDEEETQGVDSELLVQTNTSQVIHTTVRSLSDQKFSHPIIFDLCLDLFNNESDAMYVSDLWSESEVMEFLFSMKKIITEAELVTVSLSFGYSGTEDDTRRLAKLVLPILEEWRK